MHALRKLSVILQTKMCFHTHRARVETSLAKDADEMLYWRKRWETIALRDAKRMIRERVSCEMLGEMYERSPEGSKARELIAIAIIGRAEFAKRMQERLKSMDSTS